MELTENYAKEISFGWGFTNMLKQIEYCGRICYRSENNKEITRSTALDFVNRMIASKHLSVLEHGSVYLAIPFGWKERVKYFFKNMLFKETIYSKYKHNKYSQTKVYNNWFLVTTNYRVIIENKWVEDIQYFPSEGQPQAEFPFLKRYTYEFQSDIQVSKEATRHRPLSPSVESTRYCNYNSDKFGKSVKFSKPVWLYVETENNRKEFEEDCKTIENIYMKWQDKGWTQQQAAYFLPQGTASKFALTGSEEAWTHFVDCRFKGVTGKPHPSMLEVAVHLANRFMTPWNKQ